MSFRKKKLVLGLIALLLPSAIGCGQPVQASALQTVKRFYWLHFRRCDRMYFDYQNIRRKRKWLTLKLYRLMLSEFRRDAAYAKAHPDPPPKNYFSGDVFTNSEEYPHFFRVTTAKEEKGRAIVTVWVYWRDKTLGTSGRKIRVVLLHSQTGWLIDNLLYQDGKDLVTQLKRPKSKYYG